MIDNPNSAKAQSHAAYVHDKVLVLIERIRRLNFDDGNVIVELIADKAAKPCVVRINLRLIAQLLHLTELEKAWLETAYIWTRCGLALPDVQIADEAMRYRVLGGVLDQEVSADDKAWSNSTQRLRGIGLIAPRSYRFNSIHWLGDDLMCYPAVIEVLEKRHLSHAHLLNALLQPRLDIAEEDLMFGSKNEPNYLIRMPPVIEDSYRRYRATKPLCIVQLMALIPWWCDWIAFDVQDLLWLTGRVHMPEIRQGIQTATRIACQEQRALTGFDLLKALYAVAA